MNTTRIAVLFILFALTCGTVTAAVPNGFTEALVVSGLSSPTSMAFANDGSGRIFVCEQGGAIRVVNGAGSLEATAFHNLTVNSSGERGLLGIAFDPDFINNQFIYVYYTATTPTIHNRLSRFKALGNVKDPNVNEFILLELETLGATNHNGGAIHFGTDGKLYVAVGENAVAPNAQSFNNKLGKMLRINTDGSIPTDNPYFNSSTVTGQNKLIWALGLRNPYTFAVQPGTGRILINDVGGGSWEEINDRPPASPGGFPNPRNYGWASAEGSTMCTTYLCPLFAYPHSGAPFTGCAITGGTFYNPTTQQFPAAYQGDYFFSDYCGNYIKKLELSNNSYTDFSTTAIVRPVDLDVRSDGSLYYLARGGGSSTGAIYRIQYTATQGPSITTQPANKTVTVGASATFTVVASGTAPLSYQWQRDSLDIPDATSSSYTLNNAQLTDSGAQFRCAVTNSFGNVTSNQAQLTVTQNTPPTANIISPANESLFNAGQTINYSGSGLDSEDTSVPASRFTWWVDLHHDEHSHPHVQPVSGSTSGNFSIPTSGETDDNQWYRIYLRVTDSGGLENTTYVEIFPRKVTINLASNPSGMQLKLDGQAVTAPFSFVGIVGMTRNIQAVTPQLFGGSTYNFVSWSDGGLAAHNITVPASNTTYTATFNTGVVNGDGLRGTYYSNPNLTGNAGNRVDRTINFDWGTGSPGFGVHGDTFSIRWTGFVKPEFTQTYTFRTNTNDGVRVWVNGKQLINAWVNTAGLRSGTIALTAGQKYSIKVEFYENKNAAKCILQWSSASQPLQVIPQNRLYSQ